MFSLAEKRNMYMAEAANCSDIPDLAHGQVNSYLMNAYRKRKDEREEDPMVSVLVTKKYKPVALKVKPVYAELPGQYRITRNIKGDPLAGMPRLNPVQPNFVPIGRYTQERKEEFD
jgi:hypothetical protein